MILTRHETMWMSDSSTPSGNRPIQYEVRGLPRGHDRILIAQTLGADPPQWTVRSRPRDGASTAWIGDHETPEAALDVIDHEQLFKSR